MSEYYPKFFTYFKAYQDAYVVIGGQAAAILLAEAGVLPRATVDLDLIVVFEHVHQPFIDHFKQFLRLYHYELNGRQDDGRKHYYRFKTAQNSEVPVMIELFSKVPLDFELAQPGTTEIPLDDQAASLSAISLDGDYYALLTQGVTRLPALAAPVLKPAYLILFKAKAQLEITARLAAGLSVNRRDRTKHKTDIYRLLSILTPQDVIHAIAVPLAVQQDLQAYIVWLQQQPNIGPEVAHLKLARFGRNPRQAAQRVLSALKNLIQ